MDDSRGADARMTGGWPRRLKRAAWTALRRGRGLEVVRWLSRREPRVLLFHRFGEHDTRKTVGVETFERQLRLLRERFHVTSMREIAERRHSSGPLPPNCVSLTVDDGYSDFYEHAFPVLRRYGMPATLFVTTRFADGRIWLWPDLIEYALFTTRRSELCFTLGSSSRRWLLSDAAGRSAAWSDIADYCLMVGVEGTRRITAELCRVLEVDPPEAPTAGYRAATWDQIREMAAAGVDIGSHTRTHPRLSLLSPEVIVDEIEGSKRDLEAQLQGPVRSFAYPHGTAEDFDERCRHAVAAAGYSFAVAGYFDADVLGDGYAIKRLPVGTDWGEFLKAVFGVKHLMSTLGLRS